METRECQGVVVVNNNKLWMSVGHELIEIHKDNRENMQVGQTYTGYIKKIKLFPREGDIVIMCSENLGQLSKNVTKDRLLLEASVIEGFVSKSINLQERFGDKIPITTFSLKVDMLNGSFKYMIAERRSFVIKEKDYIKIFVPKV